MHVVDIDRASSTPIFRQIESHILRGIREGQIKPGDRIPSQNDLARECQVSRATVQRALERLIMDDVLYYQPGKGLYVTSPVERQRLPILQSFTQILRSLGHRVEADLLLAEEIAASPPVAGALALAEGSEVILVKRLQYANGEPMMLQTVYLEAARFRRVLERDLRNESLTEIIQEIGGIYIEGSVVTFGAGVANWEEARTLNIQAGNPLLTIEEIDCDGKERPVRFSRIKLRGDRFRATANTFKENGISLEYRLQPGTVSITLL
ncbi:MAG: GntR family transcriptional regulator [Chloroflexota bacterium]|nr:GntR family transcriptional regulator [Chloroflexota bacterium]